jgi:hypothetical protein
MPSAEVQIAFTDREGNPVASISLYPELEKLGDLDTLRKAAPAETIEYGESEVQSLKRLVYQYELIRRATSEVDG